MATVINACKKYFLHSESYKALNENENQGLYFDAHMWVN